MTVNLASCRVLVTPRSYGEHDGRLKTELEDTVGEVVYNPTGHSLSAGELRELIPGCHGMIAGVDVIDRSVIEAADRLRVIARYGVGVDRVDLDAARERGIIVTNTPAANSASVAELTIGLMLGLARMIPLTDRQVRAGQTKVPYGTSLEGKVIGLIGLGAVGRCVAERLRGFRCTVLACDPFVTCQQAAEVGATLRDRQQVIERSDFLSLHVPVLEETRGMVDADFLAGMKPHAYLINTARGELVDEKALFAALTGGQLSGAALDAFAEEPPSPDNPLLALPQVIATLHIGANTDGARNAMGWGALHDCLAVLRGEEPQHRVI